MTPPHQRLFPAHRGQRVRATSAGGLPHQPRRFRHSSQRAGARRLSRPCSVYWARIAARCLRRISAGKLAGGDVAGSLALRQAVAAYLGASRGVCCSPDHIVIVSGAQQALDFLARLLVKPGDKVWVEDPAYTGAVDAFRNAKARIVPVPVDENGLDPDHGRRLCPNPKAVYLTPAHQFAIGVTARHVASHPCRVHRRRTLLPPSAAHARVVRSASPRTPRRCRRRDLRGIMLGFAAFTEREIRSSVLGLAKALA